MLVQRAPHNAAWRGFSLVELMVVIAVLGLLVTAITLIAGRTIYNQRKANTLAIMRNCTLALEQFAQEDPLRAIYDRRDSPTFGPYPPYTLEGRVDTDTVRGLLDGGATFNTLAARLHRDLGQEQGSLSDWVQLNESDQNDDARALYIYLKVFSPAAAGVLPQDRLKPLDPRSPEFVNPKGSGGRPGGRDRRGQSDWIDVFAVHDAWDVPLDYLLYVKVARNPEHDIDSRRPEWVIVDRRPVLRSRGIKRDAYEAGANDPQRWLFSEPLPQPWAEVDARDGRLTGGTEGWLRAVAKDDDYKFRPDQDLP